MKRVHTFVLALALVLLMTGAAQADIVTNPHFLDGTDGWSVWLTPTDEVEGIYCDGNVLTYDATTLDIQADGCFSEVWGTDGGSIARVSQTVVVPASGEYELRLRYNHYDPSSCVDHDFVFVGYFGYIDVMIGDWHETLTGYEEGWLEQSFVITLPQGEHVLRFQVVADGLSDVLGYWCTFSDHAYLDELDLVPLTTATESLSLSAVKSRY